MEQRRVRLGDVVDDYCPRERRVTNHAVVAMIEDEIRQTRCTACDTEHPYKGARLPRRKKKDAPAALYAAVLAGRNDEPKESGADGPLAAAPPMMDANVVPDALDETEPPVAPDAPPAAPDDAAQTTPPPEDGPVRRPLIRATLPRPDGQQTTRPAPEFTMRQSGVRGGRLIDGDSRGNTRGGSQSSNGSRPPRHARHGSRPAHGHAQGHGHGRPHGSPHGASRHDRSHGHSRGHQPGHPTRGGNKRSR